MWQVATLAPVDGWMRETPSHARNQLTVFEREKSVKITVIIPRWNPGYMYY
jgi:hypothetical protein